MALLINQNFILFLVALGLRFWARAFSSCSKWGLLFVALHGLLIAGGSLFLWSTGFRWVGSVVVAQKLLCPKAFGIFLDQEANPCPMHWQEDSYPQDMTILCLKIISGFLGTKELHFYVLGWGVASLDPKGAGYTLDEMKVGWVSENYPPRIIQNLREEILLSKTWPLGSDVFKLIFPGAQDELWSVMHTRLKVFLCL